MNDIDWAWLLFSFEGRINRGKFWLGIVVLWAVVWVLALIAGRSELRVPVVDRREFSAS